MKTLIILLLMSSLAYAETIDYEKLVDSIFISEGGYTATYLYGIRSVKYASETEARQICMNTCVNQMKRHTEHECGLDYISCLSNRYAPLNASNDPQGLNANWKKNVLFFYNKGE